MNDSNDLLCVNLHAKKRFSVAGKRPVCGAKIAKMVASRPVWCGGSDAGKGTFSNSEITNRPLFFRWWSSRWCLRVRRAMFANFPRFSRAIFVRLLSFICEETFVTDTNSTFYKSNAIFFKLNAIVFKSNKTFQTSNWTIGKYIIETIIIVINEIQSILSILQFDFDNFNLWFL